MIINSESFTYYKDENTFSTFASDVEFKLERIFPDSCDLGFTMISERTGNELAFYVAKTETSDEGELQAWHFKVHTKDPALKNITAVIFND